MITAQFFFNFICITLLMTVLVLEKYEKVAMSIKYIGAILLLFIIMSIGYLIWPPQLDMISYTSGIINTMTLLVLQIFVNVLRIAICIYAIYKYVFFTKKLKNELKNKIQWFCVGVIIAVIGLFLNLYGGAFNSILFEIMALIVIDAGFIVVFKGFLI